MTWTLTLVALRLGLAAVFATAGVAKLTDRRDFGRALRDFGVADRLTPALAVAVPVAELGVAAALVLPVVAWWAALAGVVLLATFMAVIGRSLARGEKPTCKCFGRLSAGQIGRRTLVRNGILLVAAGVIVAAGPSRVAPGALGWVAELTGVQRLGLAAVVVIAGLLTSQGWLLTQVLRQNGRILNRVAALEGALANAPAGRPGLPLLPAGNGGHGNGAHGNGTHGNGGHGNGANGNGNGHNGHHHGPPGLTNGHPAPAIRLPDLDGDLVEADLRGGLTVLLFWNPGCGFCQQMLPALRTWADERPDDAPSLLVIAAGSAEDNRAQGLAATVLLDADFSTAHEFGATGTPQAVLVGPDGGIASPLARGADAVARLLDARLAPT
jgi:uncharacterized membrane protein YphA (DoxX/SURF4 family)/thiol-disulfide isomerase/thioredoxin